MQAHLGKKLISFENFDLQYKQNFKCNGYWFLELKGSKSLFTIEKKFAAKHRNKQKDKIC